MPGPVVVGGKGARLRTADGGQVLDAGGGAIVANVGHGRHEVADAVAAALHEIDYVVPVWATPNRVALAEELTDRRLPERFTRVFLTSGGSEAMDSAIRLARLHHAAAGRDRRTKVVGRHPSYHGSTFATLAAGSHLGRRAGLEPMLPDWPKVPWDDGASLAKVIEQEDADTIAAFVAEPVIGAAGGALVADDAYWATVTELCHSHGILLVADEVMCGVGRTGRTWGHEHWPFVPDIVAGAKGLGGGYVPIGLVAATEAVVAPLETAGQQLMYFTFSAHDSVCAGALAVLRILHDEALVARAEAMGEVLHGALLARFADHPHVADVRGRGLMLGVELTADRATGEPLPPEARVGHEVVMAGLERGVWFYPAGSGPVQDAVMLGPPFVIDESDVAEIVEVLAASIDTAVSRLG